MIVVTGTKRSGTSMWMQVLRAAGLTVFGKAFPKDWGEVLRDANPEGFYESHLRRGIYFATNPHPKTGEYIAPAESRHVAVKVFVPGVIRSDVAFLDKVVASMRSWREYPGSIERLYAMEQENRKRKREREGKGALPPPRYIPPVLEWWSENFSLISDVLTRRYPIHMTAYESILANPRDTIGEAIDWLGVGDREKAIEQVRPMLRTHVAADLDPPPDVEPDIADVLDELYARVRDRKPLDAAFIDRLNETNERLEPRIAAAEKDVRLHRLRRRRDAKARERADDGADQ